MEIRDGESPTSFMMRRVRAEYLTRLKDAVGDLKPDARGWPYDEGRLDCRIEVMNMIDAMMNE